MKRQRTRKPITRFAITTDASNFIVNEKKVYGKDSAHLGEEYLKPVGYYGTLELALQGMVKKGQLLDNQNPTDILAALAAQKEEIHNVVVEFGKYRYAEVEKQLAKAKQK